MVSLSVNGWPLSSLYQRLPSEDSLTHEPVLTRATRLNRGRLGGKLAHTIPVYRCTVVHRAPWEKFGSRLLGR